jgi:uncharacterized protein YheU (UPF0270 family)
MNNEKETLPPIDIQSNQLSESALKGIIESFILREGTDYGAAEVSFETKVEQIKRQLERGDIKIVFDPNTESVTIMTKRDWMKLKVENHP